MAFEDSSTTTTGAGSRYLGEGFRQEPDFREGSTTVQPTAPTSPPAGDVTMALGKRSTTNLDYVFDDPADGEPGRDRMLVHGVWELVLAAAVAGFGYVLYQKTSADFSGDGLRHLLLSASVLGLLAVSAAVALRAGTPNLSIGAVAVAAGLYFGQHSSGGLLWPILVVAGLCAAVGAVQGLVVVGLHVPSWAATLGASLFVIVWANRQAAMPFPDIYNPTAQAYWWFGGFVGISLVAGLMGLVPSVRRGFARFRPVADPAHRRGIVASVIALVAIVASTILAGVAGVLSVSVTHAAAPSDGLDLTALAIGAALLGGTSAFGRRGGVFGTIFAVALLSIALRYVQVTQQGWSLITFAGLAIAVGLVVTRLVERFGRPWIGDRVDEDETEWTPQAQSGAANGWAPKTWQPATASAPTTSTSGGLWASDEAWGTER
jgi:ribose/xylose/arabinose/galactoside ABC-type transport system permease subunit